MIRRRGQAPEEEESSSDDEDAFAALGNKKNAKRSKIASITPPPTNNNRLRDTQQPKTTTKPTTAFKLPVALTSSMKRHHKTSDTRKAKMDALLLELAADQKRHPSESNPNKKFVPEKKGSFVDPGEEHLTTNIFVGNLSPSVTEEDLTDLFLQFGELYSIKIMWPRTEAERNRKRNTGFVCFMNREDAEEAMEACNETDPFNVGRQLMMRWGKNVKRSIQQGTGGGIKIKPIGQAVAAPSQPSVQTPEKMDDDSMSNIPQRFDGLPHVIQFNADPAPKDISKATAYDPQVHSANAIRVELLDDPKRFHFISTVAKYVAKDGSSIEKKLIEKEVGNQLFNFLTLKSASAEQWKEHVFYRWRVYSFCQGGDYFTWRTDPFIMFHPHGRFWVPPPLGQQAKQRAEANTKNKQKDSDKNQDERPQLRDKAFMTGRQIERARGGRRKGNRKGLSEGRATMTNEELEQFDLLVKKKLTVSRETICQAMAFCFEKSGSAREIADLLKSSLVDEAPYISIDSKIARLYLLSDILFNSQQPGVKNAFMYRDSIEKMAPEVFASLGRKDSRDGSIGRMTMQKLRTAISAVLGAWTEWSVYNPSFMDELEARFEGREIPEEKEEEEVKPQEEKEEKAPEPVEIIIKAPRGGWTEVSADQQAENVDGEQVEAEAVPQTSTQDTLASASQVEQDNRIASTSNGDVDDVDGAPMEEEDIDGEVVDESNVDGISISQAGPTGNEDDIDGAPVDDIDGVSMGDADVDGEPIEGEADVDGEPLDESNVDGIPMDQEDLGVDATAQLEDVDGEEIGDLDGEEVDGSPLDHDDVDLDGEEIDGEELDGEEL